MRLRIVAGVSLFFFVASFSACGEAPSSDLVEVRDSAGVTLVENLGAPEALPHWELSPAPSLTIGVVAGPDALQFTSIVGAARLPSMQYVILDRTEPSVRWFGADGQHLGSAGREGEGPGEFTGPRRLAISGDTVFVYDQRQRRWTTFVGPDSLVDVTGAPPLADHTPIDAWPVQQDIWLAAFGSRRTNMSGATEYRRDPVLLLRSAARGGDLDTVAVVDGQESFDIAVGGNVIFAAPPFPRNPVYATHGDFLYHGNAERFEFTRLNLETGEKRITRFAGAERPLPAWEVEAFRDSTRAFAARTDGFGRESMEIMEQEAPVPEIRPAYNRLLISADGLLCFEESRSRFDHESTIPLEWLIFDPDGSAQARMVVPPQFHVLEVGTDYVLGRWTDELDVQSMRVFSLTR